MFRLFQFPEFHYWYKCFCSCLLTIFLQNVGYDTDQYISCIKYCLIFFFHNLGLFLSIFLWSEIYDRKCVVFFCYSVKIIWVFLVNILFILCSSYKTFKKEEAYYLFQIWKLESNTINYCNFNLCIFFP